MRVVVLGGSGVQGRAAAATVLDDPAGHELVLVARERAKLASARASLGDRASIEEADVTDELKLATLLRPGDFVLNAASPFFAIGAAPARAAVAAGAHYADIGDDWEATEPVLELHDVAVERGLSVVTGFGGAPGVDSMLAVEAMRLLDEVDEIVTAWSFGGASEGHGGPQTLTPYVHFLQCCVGPIALTRAGRRVLEEPLASYPLVLPDGQEIEAWTIGSPEAITLQRGRPEVRDNLNVMMTSPEIAAQLRDLAGSIRRGELTLDQAAALLRDAGGREQADNSRRPSTAPSTFGLAIGREQGRPARAMAHLRRGGPRTYEAAGCVLGMSPALFAAGKLALGAHAIETALSPVDYFEAVSQAAGGDGGFQLELALRLGAVRLVSAHRKS